MNASEIWHETSTFLQTVQIPSLGRDTRTGVIRASKNKLDAFCNELPTS